jgi:hypothetical protein
MVRVGVTGHRFLAEIDTIAAGIEEALRRIEHERPGESLAVVSSLAEGADRLVVRHVLKRSGARLITPLPLARAAYMDDFSSTESKAEFSDLVAAAGEVVQLPEAASRAAAYRAAGTYVLDHCDVLLAVWDGQSAQGRGGTAHIVEQARMRGLPVAWVHAGNRRPGTRQPSSLGAEQGAVTFENWGSGDFSAETIAGLDRFDAFVVNRAEQDDYVKSMYDELFSPDDGLPEEVKQVAREKILPSYARASLLAKSNQKLYRRSGLVAYSFSALAVAAVAVAMLVPRMSFWAFALELALLLAVLVAIVYANKRRAHTNWIEARYLTERLRSLVFLFACGFAPSRGDAFSTTGVADSAGGWMHVVFDRVCAQLPPLAEWHGQPCDTCASFIRRRWVERQIEFHERTAAAAGRMNHRLELAGFGLFALAVMAAALHLVVSTMHIEWPERLLTFAAIFLPAAGAALGGIRSHREYSRIASRSGNMALTLKALDKHFDGPAQPDELSALLRRMEELSLRELQDWLTLMSFAKLEATA